MSRLTRAHKSRIRKAKQRDNHKQDQRILKADGEFAVMGKPRGDGVYTLYGDGDNNDRVDSGKVYVRLGGNEADVRDVWAVNVGHKIGMTCWLKRNSRGERYVDRLEDEGAVAFAGEAASDYVVPVQRGTATHQTPGRNIIDLQAHLSAVGGLTIAVESGWYDDTAGVRRYFGVDGSENTLLLVVPSTSGNVAWCVVWLDRSDGTLDKTLGTQQAYPLTKDDIETITATLDSDIATPLWAIPLTNGQTSFTTINDWVDLRGWGASGSGVGFDADNIVTDALYQVVVDALGNVVVSS